MKPLFDIFIKTILECRELDSFLLSAVVKFETTFKEHKVQRAQGLARNTKIDNQRFKTIVVLNQALYNSGAVIGVTRNSN